MEEKKLYRSDVKLDIETVLEPFPLNSIITKTVTIISAIWQNNETGYSIYMVEEDDVGQFKVNGVFPAPLVIQGEYEIKGYVSIYKGEKQLSCKSYKFIPTSAKESIKQYLDSFDKMYLHIDDIYNIFKEDTIKTMRNSPNKIVQKIPNIDISLALKWQLKIKEDEEIEATMLILNSLGLSLRDSRMILQKHGSGVVYKLKKDPYFLIGDIPSMTFKKCDKIAIENGYELDSLGRGQQALIYILEALQTKGDCYISKDKLLSECIDMLTYSIDYDKCKAILMETDRVVTYTIGKNEFSIDRGKLEKTVLNFEASYKKTGKRDFNYAIFKPTEEFIKNSFEILLVSNKVVEENEKCYLSQIYEAEKYISEKIYKIIQNSTAFPNNVQIIEQYLSLNKIVLEKEQDKAVRNITEEMGGFFVINGGPGCGKTFIAKIIINILKLKFKENGLNLKIKLLAPTGRASKVLKDATGLDASTLHKDLEYKEDMGFLRNEENPLIEDLIIIDESSMLDVLIAEAFFKAVSNKSKVIFIGDIDQLPPIGPGCVLKDIINSDTIKVNTLNVPKRQLNKSTIITNAKNIASGEMIRSDVKRRDFIVLKKEKEFECKDAIIKGIHELIGKQNYTIDDIQVLTPQKSGVLGTNMLNFYIQETFNPKKDGESEVFKQKIKIRDSKRYSNKETSMFFRIGDKVMHIQNNYNKQWYVKDDLLKFRKDFSTLGIMNGECGLITNIEKINDFGIKREKITVEYDGGYVFYEDDFSELEHAYAITIHKSQGSQWPAVIIPMLFPKNTHKSFFTNNLIYTGCTRCKSIGIVIGSPEDILFAIKNKNENDRNTSLAEVMKNIFNIEA